MKRCSSCNMLCEDYATVCSRCGHRLDARPSGAASVQRRVDPPMQQGGNTAYAGYVYGNRFDHTREFSPEEISKGKPLAMVTYLMGTVGVLLGMLNKDSEYVYFHARQNLKYMILNWLIALSCLIMMSLFAGIGIAARSEELLKFGSSFMIIYIICYLVIFILKFICFVWVGQGKAVEALLVRHMGFLK